jgi:putative endonuclease
MTEIGQIGEQFVSDWLKEQGFQILAHRWRCRWGEIDLIAQSPHCLVFVEVKTRSKGNWDADGLLAITTQKQRKLCQAAALFLAESPHLADFPCRFDVALVHWRKPQHSPQENRGQGIQLGQPILWQGYQLTLQTYLESAFEECPMELGP